jgi:hypothetical protein
MNLYRRLINTPRKTLTKPTAARVGKLAMNRTKIIKKTPRPPICLINKLVNQHKLTRPDLLTKRANRAGTYKHSRTKRLQSKNIRKIRNPARIEPMPLPVPVKKSNIKAPDPPNRYRTSWPAERRIDLTHLNTIHTLNQRPANTRTADYTQNTALLDHL